MKNLQLGTLILSFFLLLSCGDPCENVVCGDNGECDFGQCFCVFGYEGDNCETVIRAKFLGTWNSTDWTCDGIGPEDHQIVISEGYAINEIIIEDSRYSDTQIEGIMFLSTTFSIPNQKHEIMGEIQSFTGSINIKDSLMTTIISNCSGTMTK